MGSRAFVGVLAGLVVWLTPGPALASPGDLDPSFGKFGIVGGAGGAAKDLELLPGGDAVYLSSSVNGSGSSVERVGGAGRLIASYALPESFGAAALAVQPDGAIVVSGAVGGSAAAVRVRPGGALDPSFGGGGVAVIDIPGSFEIAEDVVVDEGGRAVLAVAAGSSGAGLYRLDSDGSVDPGFGEPAVPSGLEGRPTKLVLDPSDGYLLGSGFAEDFQATAQVTRFDGAGEVEAAGPAARSGPRA